MYFFPCGFLMYRSSECIVYEDKNRKSCLEFGLAVVYLQKLEGEKN